MGEYQRDTLCEDNRPLWGADDFLMRLIVIVTDDGWVDRNRASCALDSLFDGEVIVRIRDEQFLLIRTIAGKPCRIIQEAHPHERLVFLCNLF